VLVTPDLNTAGGESVGDNLVGTDQLTIQNHKAALAETCLSGAIPCVLRAGSLL
jgi:hypothetical protein